jgi:hypothetical protein
MAAARSNVSKMRIDEEKFNRGIRNDSAAGPATEAREPTDERKWRDASRSGRWPLLKLRPAR